MSSTARRCSSQYAHTYTRPTSRRNHTFSQQTTRTKANSSTPPAHKIFQVRKKDNITDTECHDVFFGCFSICIYTLQTTSRTREVFDASRFLIKIAFMFQQFIRHIMNRIYLV